MKTKRMYLTEFNLHNKKQWIISDIIEIFHNLIFLIAKHVGVMLKINP